MKKLDPEIETKLILLRLTQAIQFLLHHPQLQELKEKTALHLYKRDLEAIHIKLDKEIYEEPEGTVD